MRNEFSISAKAKSLFLSLAESIAQTPNVTSCYVYGGGQHGRPLALRSKGVKPMGTFNEIAFPKHRKGIWLLKTSIIGNYCFSHPEGQLSKSVGDLNCLGPKFYNNTAQETQWWGAPNHTKPQPHPLAIFFNLQRAWNNFITNIDWQVPSDYIGSVRSRLIWCYLAAGLDCVC
jgi:hypothetical protein